MNFGRVRIARLNERGRQNAKHGLAFRGRRGRRVFALAVDVANIFGQRGRYARKCARAVGRKVAVRFPRLSVVRRLLDDHGGRPERLERHYDVSEHELSLQIKLDVDALLAILRLPPSIEAIALFAANYVLNDVAVVHVEIVFARVANKTFGGIFGRAEHAVAFGLREAARGAGE